MFRRPGKVLHPPRNLAPQKKAAADDLEIIEFLLSHESFDVSVEVKETVIKCRCHAGNITRELLTQVSSLDVDYRVYNDLFIFARPIPMNQLTNP